MELMERSFGVISTFKEFSGVCPQSSLSSISGKLQRPVAGPFAIASATKHVGAK